MKKVVVTGASGHIGANLVRALLDAREELLFLVAMLLGAGAVLYRPDGEMLDVRVWAVMLATQAVPYAAAVLLSMISAVPHLPERLVGRMRQMAHPQAG